MRITGKSGSVALLIALVVLALRSTAGATSGTVVHIADPTTAANVAKVNASGHLLVAQQGIVATRAQPPLTPFRRLDSFRSYYENGNTYEVVLGPTNATLAIGRIAWSNPSAANSDIWEIELFQTGGATMAECLSFSLGWERLEWITLAPRETRESVYPSPMVVKPRAGSPKYCLTLLALPPSTTGNPSAAAVKFDGYVTAGTFTGSSPQSSSRPPEPPAPPPGG